MMSESKARKLAEEIATKICEKSLMMERDLYSYEYEDIVADKILASGAFPGRLGDTKTDFAEDTLEEHLARRLICYAIDLNQPPEIVKDVTQWFRDNAKDLAPLVCKKPTEGTKTLCTFCDGRGRVRDRESASGHTNCTHCYRDGALTYLKPRESAGDVEKENVNRKFIMDGFREYTEGLEKERDEARSDCEALREAIRFAEYVEGDGISMHDWNEGRLKPLWKLAKEPHPGAPLIETL